MSGLLRARCSLVIAALSSLAMTQSAAAQIAVDRFRGSLPGEPFSQVAVPKYQVGWPLVIRVGLSTRWIHTAPLRDPSTPPRALTDLLSLESMLSVAPHESFMLYAGVPVMALERGGRGAGIAPDARTPFVSDPRIGARVRAVGYTHSSASVHLAGELQLDSSWWNGATHANDRTLRGALDVLLGGCLFACIPGRLAGPALLWGANVGAHFRPRPITLPNGAVVGAHELRLALAGAFRSRFYTDALGMFELRLGLEAAAAQQIFVPDVSPHVELSAPISVVISQDIDVTVAPSLVSPIAELGVVDGWHFALSTRLSYALHERVLDRATERRRAMPLSDANDEQDSDRDGAPDRADRCPNDPHDDCVTDAPVRRPFRDARPDIASVRVEDNFVLVDGVTTLERPLAFSLRVDGAPLSTQNDPGYLFSDPVVVRALRERLVRLPSDGQVVIALWLRIDSALREQGQQLRRWALAALARALVADGLDASISLDAAPGFELSAPARTPEDRFSLVLLASRRSTLGRSPSRPSDWMPASMMQGPGERADGPRRPPEREAERSLREAPSLEAFRADFSGRSAL